VIPQKIKVLKFGSSVLTGPDDLDRAVHEIYRCSRQGYQVVAVVSALGNTTNQLLQSAKELAPRPNDEALAELLATGELESATLLNLALSRAGIPSHVLDAARVGIQTAGEVLDSDPVGIDVAPLLRRLDQRSVLVVPGFIGQHQGGSLSLLGRGGSDISALFLAHRLNANCRLLKDVAGLYEWDPTADGPRPRLYEQISYASCRKLDGDIVQQKAVRFAEAHGLKFEVGECAAEFHSEVGAEGDTFHEQPPSLRKLTVSLLGLGTVGYGVYRHLLRHPEKFELTSILVSDLNKKRSAKIAPGLLVDSVARALSGSSNLNRFAASGSAEFSSGGATPSGGNPPGSRHTSAPDLVVDALAAGVERTAELLRYLKNGGALVTADKQLISESTSADGAIRAGQFSGLHYSAAVGGVLPAVETVQQIAAGPGVRSIEGVLNGTSNFVLQQIAQGFSLDEAILEAQQLGFAEADPSADLSGLDAARKLVVLATVAWGRATSVSEVHRIGLEGLTAEQCQLRPGETLRVVARAEQTDDGLKLEVVPRWLPKQHALALAVDEGNALLITDQNSETILVQGKGAGRWPTAEAVFADCLDVWRSFQKQGVLA
jgi:homoserine dehydrogenase